MLKKKSRQTADQKDNLLGRKYFSKDFSGWVNLQMYKTFTLNKI